MKRRQYLKKSILLCGESDGAVFKRTFVIVKKLSEGASSVCYEAYHENSGRGVLKEFYPKDAYALERTAEGQLIHSQEFQDAYKRFLKAEREYLEPYKMLLDVKKNSENQDLATFIPAFEIYHGCDDNEDIIGTTYIWTPEPKLETFKKVCDEIHKHPDYNPEHKLVTVLSAIETLVKCICTMHSAEMIHRDINPSNFGFIKRGNETLTQTLSMFDINSICSVYGKNEDAVVTEGYQEPEVRYEVANNQTDIYSIGATLFHAVIVTDEVKKNHYLYSDEYYDRLDELVDQSRLIRASEANSHPRLRSVIARILKKCLCERTYRYANCEELLDDLEIALYYALPSEIARKISTGEKWVLTDVEKSLDVNKEKNSFLAIQYHLYEHPLYQCSSNDEEMLNVLVIGFGNYGQKFLDACLQNGQMRNKKLHVTVVSDDATDKEIYLSERPELADFFNIDGSLEKGEDTYGDIVFEITKLERGNRTANSNILQNIMCEQYDSKRPHYIFVALGEDSLNLAAANACKTATEILEIDCTVSYVREEDRTHDKDDSGLFPLYVNHDIKESAIYYEIERMAFNTHLVWEKNLNVDRRTIKTEFRKKYNHDSCVSSVLALKYKLYSLGIDLSTISFNEAARQFSVIIADKSTRKIKNQLIWIEHRRWVTEKLCLGWHRIDTLEDCATGITKDERRKKHVCIVKSRPDQKLDTEYRIGDNYDKWDKASKSDLSQLDELDRMSVELHRMFAKKAKVARKQNLLSGSNITGIRTLIEGNRRAVIAFQEWFTCLKDIWNGDKGKVRLYKGLRASFLSATELLSDERRKAVREQVKAFEVVFYPILASMEYRDWKQDDVTFIDNIPFVLTYTENVYMIIPYVTGDNTDVFGNVAAPTIVNPARIIYLYYAEEKQDIQKMKESIPYVVEYMRKKHFKATVEFVLACDKTMDYWVNEEVKTEIIRLAEGRIRQVTCLALNGMETISEKFETYLKERCAEKRLLMLEKNATRLSYMLRGAGLYNSFANYKFDPISMKFFGLNGCDMLGYIRKTPFITVTDMAAFRLSSSESSNQPEFFGDYKDLWKKYKNVNGVWKRLCAILSEYSKKNDVIASFKKKIPREKNLEGQKYRYIIPFMCNRSIKKILQFLKEQGVLEQGSRVNGYTTDSCEVVIIDRCGYQNEYDKLFSNVYALMLPDAITLRLNTKRHEVNVVFDNLMVTGVQIEESRINEISDLMNYFKEKEYVINLTISSEGKMNFTYATRQIKELLTTAGKMLEVYTYHRVKELEFDDVVSSFEIDWQGTEVKSEFDCIVTKGFRTLFIECKARSDIEQEFYYKLACLAKQFGINATAVLIADTQEKNFYDNAPINTMQRKRGNMMGVVTIWKQDEINDIGHTLLNIINGDYVHEEE